LGTGFLDTLKNSKSLKGFGSTVRRVWVEGTISGGAEFVSNRTNERAIE
jgi:hypothetical protein